MPGEFVYKIVSQRDWQRMRTDGVYDGSADDLRDGYIHFSTRDQLPGTYAKYFADQRDLVLLEVSRAALGDALRFEPSRGGHLFPHLYASLLLNAVTNTTALGHNPEAFFVQLGKDEAA